MAPCCSPAHEEEWYPAEVIEVDLADPAMEGPVMQVRYEDGTDDAWIGILGHPDAWLYRVHEVSDFRGS